MTLIAMLAVVLSSCASTSDRPTAGSAARGSSGAAMPAPSASGSPTTAGSSTVSGVIIEGIRPTCRVLDTGQRRYSLVGPGVAALREGDRVRAVGRARPELINACGTVFSVTDLQLL